MAHEETAETRVRSVHAGIFESIPKMPALANMDDYNDDDDNEVLDNCLPDNQFDRSTLTFEIEVGQGNFGFVLKASHVDCEVIIGNEIGGGGS